MKLFSTGVLHPEDLQTIQSEILPFFQTHRFQRSGVIGDLKKEGVSTHRSSHGIVLTNYSHRITNTVSIALELVGEVTGSKLPCHSFPDVQLLSYKKDDYYLWHTDYVGDLYGGHRLMSISINLNDQYEGGGLVLRDCNKEYMAPNVVGGYAVFTSLHPHQALTVTSGERRAITFWFQSDADGFKQLKNLYRESQR
jgi:predicted 2-oxoglutarate/Fe(II)-dependent dioxygenase YbiX